MRTVKARLVIPPVSGCISIRAQYGNDIDFLSQMRGTFDDRDEVSVVLSSELSELQEDARNACVSRDCPIRTYKE